MHEKLERLIRLVYRDWKAGLPEVYTHPDEESLVCFLEGRLNEKENQRIKAHLIDCQACGEAVMLNLEIKEARIEEVPEQLLDNARNLLIAKYDKPSIMEIALRLKDKALEIISTTGDVLVGQELVPAPILRSRSIKDFKDEVTIMKDFKDIRVEVKVEKKGAEIFNLIIVVKQKETQNIIKDLRVTLIKDDLELESYLSDSGSVTFEHVILGKYKIEISDLEEKLASVLLDIKV